jgi:hypothetical protein
MQILVLLLYDLRYMILKFETEVEFNLMEVLVILYFETKFRKHHTCWRSLMLIFNHQLLHEIAWNKLPCIVVGFETNEFHEFGESMFYRG